MFSRVLYYRLLSNVRVGQILFWNLVFPLALSTFLYMGMASLIHPEERTPVAVQADNEQVAQILSDLEYEGVKMYDLQTLADPRAAVEEGTLTAYVPDGAPLRVVAGERGIEAETLATILLHIDRGYQAVGEILESGRETSPEEIVDRLSEQESLFAISGEDPKLLMTNYFYTVLAMVCLGAITLGIVNVYDTEARFSAMGKRLGIVPRGKMTFLLPFTVASLLFNMLNAGVALVYMQWVLGIPFGDNIPALLATIFVGTLFALSIGMVIGLTVKGSLDIRINLGVGLYIFSSFLAGMMTLGVKQLISVHAPIVHKINPSSLLTNTFSSLYYFDNLTVFRENLTIMGGMTLGLLAIVWLLARRNQYEYV